MDDKPISMYIIADRVPLEDGGMYMNIWLAEDLKQTG